MNAVFLQMQKHRYRTGNLSLKNRLDIVREIVFDHLL